MPEYNTSRSPLILKEYGRNVQMLVDYIKTLDDKENRNRFSATLIELMKQITPSHRESTETNQKLWDDLFIMANFDLDVDSPFPIPDKEILTKKPQRLSYSSNDIRFKHFGKNMELLVAKAMEIDNKEDKEAAIIYIGKLMKSFNSTWNKDVLEDEVILRNIRILSNNELDIDIEKVKDQNLFESLYKERSRPSYKSRKGYKSGSGGPRSGSGSQRSGSGGQRSGGGSQRSGNNKRRRY